MPASIPVDDFHGALLIATILSSILFLLQQSLLKGSVASEVLCEGPHACTMLGVLTKPLQVAFLMLVDSANLVFVNYTTYDFVITKFGDYQITELTPWSQAGFLKFLYRIQWAGVLHTCQQRSSMPQDFHLILNRLCEVLGLALSSSSVYTTGILKQTHESKLGGNFPVLCDVLITIGMVYTLLSNRTRVRRTNSVLNLLAIYAINCGILHLLQYTLIWTPSLLIMVRLSLCAFMSILNSRDNLRETLDGPGGVVSTFISSRHARVPVSWPRKR
ncbi:hypothetical protein EDB85DRAFT_1893173 [Lactarius pseudohatsudake]|nr:hypothetical protein EDB85DRAFT_1893173 [Lactarius pseudohatsudake]